MRRMFICTICTAIFAMAMSSGASAGGWSGWNCGEYGWCRTWGFGNWGWHGIGWGSFMGSYYYSTDRRRYASDDCYRQVRVVRHGKSTWRREWVCD